MFWKRCLNIALVLTLWASVQGQDIEAVECPFPNGQADSNDVNCALYSACQWTGTRCHMRDNPEVGYTVLTAPEDTGRGFKVQLEKTNSLTLFNGDVQFLTFEVIYHEDFHLQIRITDTNNARYEPPVPLTVPATPGSNPLYQVSVSAVGTPFSFSVTRLGSSNVLFDLLGPLTYEDQFIQLTSKLASSYLYGFGESTHTTFRRRFNPRQSFAIFSRDQPVGTEEMNEYGHHPYYMVVEDDNGNSHSVLFFNSNAMEYSTFLLDDGTPSLTLRTIGGIVDLHFFLGPTPEDLNIQYTALIGRPVFPPYYSLGFQVSRWGYVNTDEVREVRQRMKDNNIPQDIQVFDIDYMNRYRDFTTDTVDWADIDVLIQELHTDNVKVTIILDPALVIDFANYPSAERGRLADVFIKWGDVSYIPSDQPAQCADYVVGYCWPDTKTVYPDFLNPATQDWWINEIVLLKQTLDFDVLWVDMNEPANFGTDTPRPWNYPPELPDWSLKCPYNNLDSPPYPTRTTYTGSTESHRLSDHSICMSSVQTDGTKIYRHYDVHSIYGWSQCETTYRAVQQIFPGKRNVVLSRSTFPSSGKYAVHWLGDNTAEWAQMHMSIIGMFEFNMFGIPYVGADICGFFGETNEELCNRWMEVGAFYPFSRNHNAEGNGPQDPGVWPSVALASRNALNLRYQYNPYLYYLFQRAHEYGNSVIRPLLNEFPADITARDIDDQFLWGSGLMITPILTEGSTERDVYFPSGAWYDLRTGGFASAGSETLTVLVPLDYIPVYIKGGNILPFQEPAISTTESRLNPFGATIAIQDGAAVGGIFWDDGESDYDLASSYVASLNYAQGTFTLTVDNPSSTVDGLNMSKLNFYGYDTQPSVVTLDGVEISSWVYSDSDNVLTVDIDVPLNQDFVVIVT